MVARGTPNAEAVGSSPITVVQHPEIPRGYSFDRQGGGGPFVELVS